MGDIRDCQELVGDISTTFPNIVYKKTVGKNKVILQLETLPREVW